MTIEANQSEDFWRRLYHRLPTPPNTNFLFPGVERVDFFAGLPENALIYDIGAKRLRRDKVPPGARIVTVDIDPSCEPDIVADAHDLHMIPDNSADCVISSCVLEHCAKPWIVVDELFRILKPGGRIYINVPFMFPFHADPHDNYRVTHKGIDILCEKFQKIESGFDRGPASCMTHLNIHFMALLFSFNSKTLYGILIDLLKWTFFWTKYLDVLLAKHPMSYVIHAGVYFYGQKPAPTGSQ